MDFLMPSEIARLVLGYLKEMGCMEAVAIYLSENHHLKEYLFCLRAGCEYSTSINGRSLLEMLNDYCRIKSERSSVAPDLSHVFHRIDGNLDQLKHLTMKSSAGSGTQANSVVSHTVAQNLATHNLLLAARREQESVSSNERDTPSNVTEDASHTNVRQSLPVAMKTMLACAGREQAVQTSISVTTASMQTNMEVNDACVQASIAMATIGVQTNMEVSHACVQARIAMATIGVQTSESDTCSSAVILRAVVTTDASTQCEEAWAPISGPSMMYPQTPICRPPEIFASPASLVRSALLLNFGYDSLQTPMKDRFPVIEDSSWKSPRRKSQPPRKRLSYSPASASKRKTATGTIVAGAPNQENVAHSEEGIDIAAIYDELILNNPTLHEWIADNINRCVDHGELATTEEPMPGTSEIRPPEVEANLPHRLVAPTGQIIKEIVDRTESHPMFESFLNVIMDKGDGNSQDSQGTLDSLVNEDDASPATSDCHHLVQDDETMDASSPCRDELTTIDGDSDIDVVGDNSVVADGTTSAAKSVVNDRIQGPGSCKGACTNSNDALQASCSLTKPLASPGVCSCCTTPSNRNADSEMIEAALSSPLIPTSVYSAVILGNGDLIGPRGPMASPAYPTSSKTTSISSPAISISSPSIPIASSSISMSSPSVLYTVPPVTCTTTPIGTSFATQRPAISTPPSVTSAASSLLSPAIPFALTPTTHPNSSQPIEVANSLTSFIMHGPCSTTAGADPLFIATQEVVRPPLSINPPVANGVTELYFTMAPSNASSDVYSVASKEKQNQGPPLATASESDNDHSRNSISCSSRQDDFVSMLQSNAEQSSLVHYVLSNPAIASPAEQDGSVATADEAACYVVQIPGQQPLLMDAHGNVIQYSDSLTNCDQSQVTNSGNVVYLENNCVLDCSVVDQLPTTQLMTFVSDGHSTSQNPGMRPPTGGIAATPAKSSERTFQTVSPGQFFSLLGGTSGNFPMESVQSGRAAVNRSQGWGSLDMRTVRKPLTAYPRKRFSINAESAPGTISQSAVTSAAPSGGSRPKIVGRSRIFCSKPLDFAGDRKGVSILKPTSQRFRLQALNNHGFTVLHRDTVARSAHGTSDSNIVQSALDVSATTTTPSSVQVISPGLHSLLLQSSKEMQGSGQKSQAHIRALEFKSPDKPTLHVQANTASPVPYSATQPLKVPMPPLCRQETTGRSNAEILQIAQAGEDLAERLLASSDEKNRVGNSGPRTKGSRVRSKGGGHTPVKASRKPRSSKNRSPKCRSKEVSNSLQERKHRTPDKVSLPLECQIGLPEFRPLETACADRLRERLQVESLHPKVCAPETVSLSKEPVKRKRKRADPQERRLRTSGGDSVRGGTLKKTSRKQDARRARDEPSSVQPSSEHRPSRSSSPSAKNHGESAKKKKSRKELAPDDLAKMDVEGFLSKLHYA